MLCCIVFWLYGAVLLCFVLLCFVSLYCPMLLCCFVLCVAIAKSSNVGLSFLDLGVKSSFTCNVFPLHCPLCYWIMGRKTAG